MPDEEAAAVMRQWTGFEPGLPNVVVVRCELVAKVELGPQSILKYRYWLVLGTEEEIAEGLDVLREKYAGERVELVNP